jgi:phosphoribosylformylglycinamidine (FGAM) synthase PurS component
LSAAGSEEAAKRVDSMCDRLLANPNIESYRIEVDELATA